MTKQFVELYTADFFEKVVDAQVRFDAARAKNIEDAIALQLRIGQVVYSWWGNHKPNKLPKDREEAIEQLKAEHSWVWGSKWKDLQRAWERDHEELMKLFGVGYDACNNPKSESIWVDGDTLTLLAKKWGSA